VGSTRRIINVSAGTVGSYSTDAVNGAQLYSTQTTANTALSNFTSGTVNASFASANLNSGGITNAGTISGVTAGNVSATSTDAVNGSQLYTTNQNVTAAQNTANTAQNNALAALSNLQAAVNQLVQSGVCTITGATVACGTNVQLAGGTVGAGASNGIAIGGNAQVQSSGGIALGQNATAVQSNSVAIGTGATAHSSVAVGTGAQALGSNTTALGDNAVASGNYAVAVGNNAQATHDNSVALGNGSQTSAADTVSVGAVGNERRITNVAPSTGGTDAVNLGQLNTAMTSLANGTLDAAHAYTDQQVDAARQFAARGIAATAAIMNVMPSAVGKTALSVGMGHYDGQSALGVSVAYSPRQSWVVSAGMAGTSGGSPVVRAGIAMEY
jgi:autotransporter adhesin